MKAAPASEVRVSLPATLRLECKFTTGRSVALPAREIDALRGSNPDSLGVVAVLFWDSCRELHGGWLLIDAAESFRSGANTTNLSDKELARLDANQHWLDPVRREVRLRWKSFICAFRDVAVAGHDPLLSELRDLHDSNELSKRFAACDPDIIENDYRCAMKQIIEHHGPSGAGRIFQDLLAYVLGSAGYRSVIINAVGVPDVELTSCEGDDAAELYVKLTVSEFESLLDLAEREGQVRLAQALRAQHPFTRR